MGTRYGDKYGYEYGNRTGNDIHISGYKNGTANDIHIFEYRNGTGNNIKIFHKFELLINIRQLNNNPNFRTQNLKCSNFHI